VVAVDLASGTTLLAAVRLDYVAISDAIAQNNMRGTFLWVLITPLCLCFLHRLFPSVCFLVLKVALFDARVILESPRVIFSKAIFAS